MRQFYNLRLEDVWDGREPVGHVLDLAGQLSMIPDSRVRATAAGGDQFYGWSVDTRLLADLYDRITHLVFGAFGEEAPDGLMYPRPHTEDAQPVGTVADFDTSAFLSGRW